MGNLTADDLITYFNQRLDTMDIDRKYKMELLGMVCAIVLATKLPSEKEQENVSND